MDPGLVGNACRVVVSEVAGRRNVRLRAQELGWPPAATKPPCSSGSRSSSIAGFQFEAAEGSFEMLLCRKEQPAYRAPFVVDDFTVIVEKRGGDGIRSQATVKLRVGDESMHTAAEGDGPVNALDRAVRKALLPHYPGAGGGAPGGLQGPDRGRAPGHRGAASGDHRVGPRRGAVEHGRVLREHHRGELAGAL